MTRSSFFQVLAMGGPGHREATPPLFFALSWLSAQLGDPLVWVRGPSVILGTAAVPVVYLLGVRTVGRTAALVGAAIVALSPFAIFYSIETRAYSTLLLLTALSTLALVAAVETTTRGWWALFALCSWAALYTHSTAIFVLAGQVVWAALACRSRLRELLAACLAIGLLFAPWVTRYPDQREAAAAVEVGVAGRSPAELADDLWRLVVGHPFVPLDQIPGVPALVMGAAGLGWLWRGGW